MAKRGSITDVLFEAVDSNNDGFITRAEFRQAMRDDIVRIPASGDGLVLGTNTYNVAAQAPVLYAQPAVEYAAAPYTMAAPAPLTYAQPAVAAAPYTMAAPAPFTYAQPAVQYAAAPYTMAAPAPLTYAQPAVEYAAAPYTMAAPAVEYVTGAAPYLGTTAYSGFAQPAVEYVTPAPAVEYMTGGYGAGSVTVAPFMAAAPMAAAPMYEVAARDRDRYEAARDRGSPRYEVQRQVSYSPPVALPSATSMITYPGYNSSVSGPFQFQAGEVAVAAPAMASAAKPVAAQANPAKKASKSKAKKKSGGGCCA